MSLITLTSFENYIEAHLTKTKLESEDIRCYLFDEHMVSLNPIYNLTVGGIKLKINEGDLDKASEILAELNKRPLLNESNEVITCPRCQSPDIIPGFTSMKGIKGFMSMIISFLLLVFPVYYRKVCKCKNCGKEFTVKT